MSTFLSAQNLVYNGSFEEYSECPSGPSQLPLAIGWSAPPNDDAEYFHSCATNSMYSTPFQGVEYPQYPKSGEAMGGIITYNIPGWNYREYVQGQLVHNLNSNISYYVSFFLIVLNGDRYAINNMALSFQSGYTSTSDSQSYPLNYPMHIYKFGNPIIYDTANWVKIEGIYKANGLENFIVIGNFKTDSETDTLVLNSSFSYPGSSYFIDDVSVEEITEPFWQYRDTLVHYGDSVLIGPAITGLDIDWYTAEMQFLGNAPGIYVSPETSRSYIAKERFNGNETTNTVFVTVIGGAGIIENKLEHVAIYPNPSTASFFVVGKHLHEEITLTLSDLNGKVVHSEQRFFSGQDEKVEFDVKAGVYFLHLKSAGAHEVVRKIVVR